MKSALLRHTYFDGFLSKAELRLGRRRYTFTLASSKRLMEPLCWGDVWIPMALLPAMRVKSRLRFEGGYVSAGLLERLESIQGLLGSWFPNFHPVPIQSSSKKSQGKSGVALACLFTGGVDSFYSVIATKPEALVYVVDTHNEPEKITSLLGNLVKVVGEEFSAEPVFVYSDIRATVDAFADWGTQFHGLFFSGVGALLQRSFSALVVPEGQWEGMSDVKGWGMHPRLNPLLSDFGGEPKLIFQGGSVDRFSKIEYLQYSAAVLANLRVCWRSKDELNCSKCEKCLRTMIPLEVLGASHLAGSFSWPLDLHAVRSLVLENEHEVSWAQENLFAAKRYGRNDLAEALRVVLAATDSRRLRPA